MIENDLKANESLTIAEEDATIWQSFRNGEEWALTFIFKHNFDSLYRYGLKLAQDPETVKDAIQNLFLQLWHNRHNLSCITAIRPYLLKALRNHLLLTRRQLKVQAEITSFLQLVPEVEFSPEEIFISQQAEQKQSQAISGSLAQLTKRQQEVIMLKFYEGFTYEKVAEIMALNVQSVRNLTCQAIKILKAQLLFLLILLRFLF